LTVNLKGFWIVCLPTWIFRGAAMEYWIDGFLVKHPNTPIIQRSNAPLLLFVLIIRFLQNRKQSNFNVMPAKAGIS